MGRLAQRFGELNRETERTTARFTQMSSALSAMGGALSLGAVGAMTKSFIDAGLQVEKLNKLFSAAAGSANLGSREFDYIRNLSEKMGLSIQDTAQSYGKFMAAIRGTTLEGEAGRKVFESVSGASTALGLSADETSGIFNALQQMMSKGKVQAEELRGQLGERLPGAFKMAADAMGVTTSQLDKMLKDGTVLASDLLPKLASQLDKVYGNAATEGAKSAGAEINRLNNALFETSATAGAALIPVFTDVVKAIKPALEMFQSFIGGFQMLSVEAAALPDRLAALRDRGLFKPTKAAQAQYEIRTSEIDSNVKALKDDIVKRMSISGGDYTLAEQLRQKANKPGNNGGNAPKGLTDAQKKSKDQIKDFLASAWDNAEMSNTSEYFALDSVKQMPLLSGLANFKSNPAKLGLGTANLMSLEEQAALAQAQYDRDEEARRARAERQKEEADRIKFIFRETADAQRMLEEFSPWAGMQAGIMDSVRAAEKLGDQFRDVTNNAIGGMADALTNFVMTGKMDFKSLADSIISDLTRIYMKQMVTGMVKLAGDAISSMISGAKADGGPVSGGSTYLVGERGPELFTPGASGMITPNHALGGNMNLTVNVVNQSGQQVKAKEGGTTFDGKSMVKTIILEAMDTDPQFRWAMRGAA